MRKRKRGKTEGGRQTGAAVGPVATGCVCVCACLGRAQWGSLGAWRKGSELWGQLHREQRRWEEKEWREGMGEGRERVKGRDVVSFEFENSAGTDNKE